MLAEIENFVNWVRRRNPEARTWHDELQPAGRGSVGDCRFPSRVIQSVCLRGG